MTPRVAIAIVDDQLVATVAIIADRLGRAGLSDAVEMVGFDASVYDSATEFAGAFNAFLDEHSELRLAFTDMWMGPFSGLTTLRVLAERAESGRTVPFAVGLCEPHENRILFKFAAAQMFAPGSSTLVGWFDKSNASYQESVELLRAVSNGEELPMSPALEECRLGPLARFMHQILRNRYDVTIWKFFSLGGYDVAEIVLEASVSEQSVNGRLDEYRDAINSYREIVGPRYGAEVRPAAAGQRREVVAAFAATHRIFFMTPDLETVVHRYQSHPQRHRRNRTRW